MEQFLKIFSAIHVMLYRLTGGRAGGHINGGDVLLLTATGRKSGRKRTTPVWYLKDGDRYLVAAGAAGSDRHPAWYWNSAKGSDLVQIQVGNEIVTVDLAEAEEERDVLYQRFMDASDNFVKYQEMTARRIPVLILTPRQ